MNKSAPKFQKTASMVPPAAKASEELKEQQARQKYLHECLNAVAATKEGQVVFKYILELSGHKKHKAVVNQQTGEINTESTTYNVARESLYLSLVRPIKSEYLKKIEY